MKKYIAILRGINVGGHRKILMADLKLQLSSIGFLDVSTYIQSGNVFLKTDENDIKLIKLKITECIKREYGFNVPVIVITKSEIKSIVELNPFLTQAEDVKQLHVTFLSDQPLQEDVEGINDNYKGEDDFVILDKVIYLFIKGPSHKSKLSNNYFEKQLGLIATTRNWKTTLKLNELVG
jgi:uncharacterized protein (DUF1697 family)